MISSILNILNGLYDMAAIKEVFSNQELIDKSHE